MMKVFFQCSVLFLTVLLLSCGTEPQLSPNSVQLEIVDNRPYVDIVPPENPEGEGRSYITEHTQNYDGLTRSYNERIVYDNITIYREIKNIKYYSYWLYGKVKSYEEKRTFDPSGVWKDIEITVCVYNYERKLVNYEAIINGLAYYYAGEFDPSSIDYGELPGN